jgi:dTDP-4-dehydrorhamnose reductase
VILTAAATDVDALESDPGRAFLINADGAGNVAAVCERHGIRLTVISTDYVFDGEASRPYVEDDEPNPINVYGASKLAGEQRVLAAHKDSQVVRISWLYDPAGPCFPATILRLGLAGKPLRLVNDWRSSPTSARQAARVIVRLMDVGPGIYHVVGRGDATPMELGLEVLRVAGLSVEDVRDIPGIDFHAAARRPPMSVLRRHELEARGMDDLEPWQDEIRSFVVEWMAGQTG